MPILTTMFATVFNFYCSVGLSKGFFSAFNQAFLNGCQKKFKQRFIVYSWNSCNFGCQQKKITKILRFESVERLVSFIWFD